MAIELNVDQTEEAFNICATLEMKYRKLKYERTDNVVDVHHNDRIIYRITIKKWMNGLPQYRGFTNSSSVQSANPNYFLRTQIEYHGKPS
jgi:hypothetical protein